jgi:LPXTG-motif cell wall-anchored protein
VRKLQIFFISVVCILLMVTTPFSSGVLANGTEGAQRAGISLSEINSAIDEAAKNILDGGVNSEWEAIGLARAGHAIPESYYSDHFKLTVDSQVINPSRYAKITDVERHVLAAAAVGLDPMAIENTDLVEKIYNSADLSPGTDTMTLQGNNGPVFALIALDSQQFQVPDDAKWTRQKLVDELLAQQKDNGSWSLSSFMTTPSYDITAMALIALAPYTNQPGVQSAVAKAVDFLSAEQESSGGFSDPFVGGTSSEATSQVIIGLTSNGIDPTSAAFTKEGNHLISHLLSFKSEDGGFKHVNPGNSNGMATEQALQALVAYQKFVKGEGKLYSFPKPVTPEPTLPHPTLMIEGVSQNQTFDTQTVTIRVDAKDGEGNPLDPAVELNQEAVTANSDGDYVLLLKEGLNHLVVRAEDQNEKVVSQQFNLNYQKKTEKKLDQIDITPEIEGGKTVIEVEDIGKLKEKGAIFIHLPSDSINAVLSKELMTQLIKKQATLHLAAENVMTGIPLKGFSKDKNVEISIQRMEEVKDALSHVYDFSIKQDGKEVDEFNEPVELSFKVIKEEIDQNLAAVYYYNPAAKAWEKVGGTYSEGFVRLETEHFSTYTVFSSDSVPNEDQSDNGTDEKENGGQDEGGAPQKNPEGTNKKGNDKNKNKTTGGKELPDTGVNQWYIPLSGAALFMVGILFYFWSLRKKSVPEQK